MKSLQTLSLTLVLSGIAYAGPTIPPEEAKDYVSKDAGSWSQIRAKPTR